MTAMDYEAFTQTLIADMRAHGGQVTQGGMAGRPVMLLTTTGARSGQPRMAIVNYTRDGDRYVIAGSKGGAPKDPHWVYNLRAHPEATIEAGGETFQARATITDGAERDRLWDQHVAELPWFGEYPDKTDRVIPMVALDRIG